MKNSIYDIVLDELNQYACQNPSEDIDGYISKVEMLKHQKLNIMFVGATGAGKSSTINAIFNTEIAKVGDRTDPETSFIQKFEIDNLILWDTPGLGDSPENDQLYAKQIANALISKDSNGNFVIDAVVVVIDGSNRDLGTTYQVIENIIVPYLGNNHRIVLAVNQCDVALKGRYWDYDKICPQPALEKFLHEKMQSVHNRILEATSISVTPLYYSALHHYNISKLLLMIMKAIPETKRFMIAEGLNKNPEIWKKNDEIENYNQEIQKEVTGSISKALDGAAKGAVAGATIGGLIPVVGSVLGAAVGAVLGFLGGLTGL